MSRRTQGEHTGRCVRWLLWQCKFTNFNTRGGLSFQRSVGTQCELVTSNNSWTTSTTPVSKAGSQSQSSTTINFNINTLNSIHKKWMIHIHTIIVIWVNTHTHTHSIPTHVHSTQTYTHQYINTSLQDHHRHQQQQNKNKKAGQQQHKINSTTVW